MPRRAGARRAAKSLVRQHRRAAGHLELASPFFLLSSSIRARLADGCPARMKCSCVSRLGPCILDMRCCLATKALAAALGHARRGARAWSRSARSRSGGLGRCAAKTRAFPRQQRAAAAAPRPRHAGTDRSPRQRCQGRLSRTESAAAAAAAMVEPNTAECRTAGRACAGACLGCAGLRRRMQEVGSTRSRRGATARPAAARALVQRKLLVRASGTHAPAAASCASALRPFRL